MVRDTFDPKKLQGLADQNVTVLVGYRSGIPHVNKDGSTGQDTADLARLLSFGDAKIPARPHLEPGILQGRSQVSKAIEKHYQQLVETGKGNPDLVGAVAVGAVQEYVRGPYIRETVPNAPATIAAKGSEQPLIDIGDMVGALNYYVEKAT
jgi:hypothetical protein